jgi:hypothetical protein
MESPDEERAARRVVGDEFQSFEPSEEVPNPNDEHPEEER